MRLLDSMEAEATRLEGCAAGYRMAGDNRLYEKAKIAALAIRHAMRELAEYTAALGEAKEQELEA